MKVLREGILFKGCCVEYPFSPDRNWSWGEDYV